MILVRIRRALGRSFAKPPGRECAFAQQQVLYGSMSQILREPTDLPRISLDKKHLGSHTYQRFGEHL